MSAGPVARSSLGDLGDRRRISAGQGRLVALARSENPMPNALNTAAVRGISTCRDPGPAGRPADGHRPGPAERGHARCPGWRLGPKRTRDPVGRAVLHPPQRIVQA